MTTSNRETRFDPWFMTLTVTVDGRTHTEKLSPEDTEGRNPLRPTDEAKRRAFAHVEA